MDVKGLHDLQVASQKGSPGTRDASWFLNRAVLGLARHWLALANLFWGLYVGLPLLAPVLMEAGLTLPARAIYLIYRPACHQRPERSFFIGGPELYYSAEELEAAGLDLSPLAREIGNESVGWKVAICERDVAIYGAFLLAGLAFGVLRSRLRGWRPRLRYFWIFLAPMAADGLLQLFGVYESNWLLRTITGALFGVGSVFVCYPYLEQALSDVRRDMEQRLS